MFRVPRLRRSYLGLLAILWFGSACLDPCVAHAQTFRWRIADTWADHQIFGLDCGRGGPCAAAVTFQLELASMVRLSTDHGHTWRDVLRIDSTSERYPLQIGGVQVIGGQTLFASFSRGVTAVSNDAGASWHFRQAYDSGWVVEEHMFDELSGIAIIQLEFLPKARVIVATDDSWKTSRQLAIPDSIPFADTLRSTSSPGVYPTDAAALGSGTFVVLFRSAAATTAVKSTDGGTTWRFHQFGSEDIERVRFADALTGWAYGGRVRRLWGDTLPAVHRTTDGGDTWALTLAGSRINDLAFRGTEVAAAADEKHVYSSSDGGVTWRRDSAQILGAAITYVAFPDSGDAIVATSFGRLLRTDAAPSNVGAMPNERTSLRVWMDEPSGRLVVEYHGAAEAIEVRVYNVAGNLLGALPPDPSIRDRAAFSLESLDLPCGRYVAVASIGGRVLRTVPLVRW